MRTNYVDDVLTLYLAGRVDANNAAELESEISASLAKFPDVAPTFDAGELEYISSAGLRVLLKFRKKFGKSLDVINASESVYNIFEVTGFTELLNVRKKFREISIEGCDVIGGGFFSTVYRLDAETIVKVFNKAAVNLADVEKDRKVSREVFLHDIPTAISYDIVKAGEYYGLVYEMIDSDTLSGTLSRHPERLEDLSIQAARLLKKLHTAEFEPGTFPDARNRFYAAAEILFNDNKITSDDKAAVDELLDRLPARNTLVHGDFHLKNIMVRDDELLIIDVGDAGLGHPIIDLMLSYGHFMRFAKMAEVNGVREFHERMTGVKLETLYAAWDIIMLEYFGTTDKDTLKRYDKVLYDYSSLMLTYIFSFEMNRRDSKMMSLLAQVMKGLHEAAGTLRPIEVI